MENTQYHSEAEVEDMLNMKRLARQLQLKPSEQQRREYQQYRKECLKNGVEPTVADFLGVELSDAEVDESIVGHTNLIMSWSYLLAKKRSHQSVKAMAATA